MTRFPVVLVALVLALAACGEASVESTTSTTAAATTTTTVQEPSAASTTSTTQAMTTTTSQPEPEGTVIEISVDESGEVSGGGRIGVPLGEDVTLSVVSAAADELHVHGFDLYLDLQPGVAGVLTFTADIPGVFEVELERSRIALFDLEVGG
jgi:hypothetical protein